MTRRLVAALVVALAYAAGVPAASQPAPSATPAAPTQAAPLPAAPQPAASDAPAVCLAAVWEVAPLPDGASYAVQLYSLDGATALTSGVVTLDAGTERYDLPFHDAIAPGNPIDTRATPIVIHFPKRVSVSAAFVSVAGGQNGGPCVVMPWIDAGAAPASAIAERPDGPPSLTARATDAMPVEAPAPAALAAPACADPTRRARPRLPATPSVSPSDVAAAFSGQFANTELHASVLVVLDATGKPLAARIIRPTGSNVLDTAAREAALRTAYDPVRYRCESVDGTFIFAAAWKAR